jgi:hypothetical protein
MQAGTVSYRPATPAVITFGIVIVLATGVLVVRDVVASRSPPTESGAASEHTSRTNEREDWSFVLGSPVVQVLRHRPGLRPIDVVRSHAFGWTGPTIHEVTSKPRYLRILRMDPTLSPVELARVGRSSRRTGSAPRESQERDAAEGVHRRQRESFPGGALGRKQHSRQ